MNAHATVNASSISTNVCPHECERERERERDHVRAQTYGSTNKTWHGMECESQESHFAFKRKRKLIIEN